MSVSVNEFRLLPPQASNLASDVDALTLVLTAFSTLVVCLLLVLIAYFAIHYRRRTEDEVPARSATRYWLEILWSLALLSFFLVVFFWGADVYIAMKRPAPYAMEINVVGKQWMWKIQHPGGQREINALHVPVGRPIKLIMTSQDVIHSFGIPAFRIKQDVLPGSFTTQWFIATQPGEYHLFCQEFCGTDHWGMIGRVVAMAPQDYEAWLAGTIPDVSPVSSGAHLFQSLGCAQCHGQVAPTLAGLFGRQVHLDSGQTVLADENYLRESILDPQAKVVAGYARLMPSYRGQVSEEQLADLVMYIKSLGSAWAADPPPARVGVAAPATRPVNAFPPGQTPNQPPARHQPGADLPSPGGAIR